MSNETESSESEINKLKGKITDLQLQLENERERNKRYGVQLSAALRGQKRSDEPENSGRLDAVRAMREELTAAMELIEFVINHDYPIESVKALKQGIAERQNGCSDEQL